MTPTQLRTTLARIGLTQAGAARLIGVGDRTFRRWACDEQSIPVPIVRLFALLERDPTAVAWLRDGQDK